MKYPNAAAAPKEYNNDARSDLLPSIDLRNKNMNNTSPSTPGTSVSKNPNELLCKNEGAKARNSAANKPTAFPPMSLPTK